MKFAAKPFIAFTLACMLSVSVAFAADPAPATPTKTLTPQQQKMSDCAQAAKGQNLKGPAYKAYMSDCLKKDSAAAAPTKPVASATATSATAPTGTVDTIPPATTQQEKMKACNADAKAKALKGDERKKFMSTCLSDSSATAAH